MCIIVADFNWNASEPSPVIEKEEGGVSLLNFPDNHGLYDTWRVLQFWPWYAGSLFGQTAAAGSVYVYASVCVCDEWARSGVGHGRSGGAS